MLRSALASLRGRSAILGVGHDDEHLVQAREVDHRLRLDLLVDAEVSLHDLGDLRDGNTLRKAASVPARDEHVALLDLVGALHVLDANDVPRKASHTANEAARPGSLDDDIHAESAVYRELDVHSLAGDTLHCADRTIHH